ncbi:MAG TPA: cytochrome B [Cytophagales bacterium]|nr:cytochrome B [Cytophagales bacterium]HAA17255.1 cytochrome B [Cytophagales bacterium]HAP60500.1 cytochrome B [Cytophagales bacterium]
MHTGLLHLHSLLRWVILLLLVFSIVRFLVGWLNKHSFGKREERLRLFTLIFSHVQFLVGLVLYFISSVVQFNDQTMSNKGLRFWAVEHITMMIIAIVLITIGHSKTKRITDSVKKHRLLTIFFGLALLVIFAAMPWPWREIIGRPLLRM